MKQLLFVTALLLTSLHVSAQANRDEDPYVTFGKMPLSIDHSCTINNTSCAQILSYPMVTVSLPGWTVTEYSVIIMPLRKDIQGPFHINKAELTDKVKKIIQSCAGGSGTILIEEVKIIGPDKRQRSMNKITMNYKS